jgi:hypothetical protein
VSGRGENSCLDNPRCLVPRRVAPLNIGSGPTCSPTRTRPQQRWSDSPSRSGKGTRRGHVQLSATSLPTHPTLSPVIDSSVNENSPTRPSRWVEVWVEKRGGSDAPFAAKRRPSAVDACPQRNVAPPSSTMSIRRVEPRAVVTDSSAGRVDMRHATVATLAPTLERADVLSSIKVSRARAAPLAKRARP